MEPKSQGRWTARAEPWNDLWDLPQAQPLEPCDSSVRVPVEKPSGTTSSTAPPAILRGEAWRLAMDCVTYPFDGHVERLQRLGLSARKFEQAKGELEGKGFFKVVPFGSTLHLVPCDKFYTAFGLEPPHLKRQLSLEHGFAVRLADHLVSQEPLVHRVDIEVPVGDSGATIDLVAHLKDGSREAWEVTINASNVASNAAKCQEGNFTRIFFLCRDTQVKQVAWARLRQAGLPPDLVRRCRVLLYSTLLKRQKAMQMR